MVRILPAVTYTRPLFLTLQVVELLYPLIINTVFAIHLIRARSLRYIVSRIIIYILSKVGLITLCWVMVAGRSPTRPLNAHPSQDKLETSCSDFKEVIPGISRFKSETQSKSVFNTGDA